MKTKHQLFGANFNKSVIALLCSLKRVFGSIDRNIRNRVIKEWAETEGVPTKQFSIPLKNWTGITKWMYFIHRDKKQKILKQPLIQKVFFSDIAEATLAKHCQFGPSVNFPAFFQNTPFPIFSFAMNPFTHEQPSGHFLDNHLTLYIECESVVENIEVHAFFHGLIDHDAKILKSKDESI
jgi:hypothetical protein